MDMRGLEDACRSTAKQAAQAWWTLDRKCQLSVHFRMPSIPKACSPHPAHQSQWRAHAPSWTAMRSSCPGCLEWPAAGTLAAAAGVLVAAAPAGTGPAEAADCWGPAGMVAAAAAAAAAVVAAVVVVAVAAARTNSTQYCLWQSALSSWLPCQCHMQRQAQEIMHGCALLKTKPVHFSGAAACHDMRRTVLEGHEVCSVPAGS